MKIHYDEASEPYAVTLGEETYYYIRNAVGDVKGLINADTGEYVYALNTSAYGVLNFIEPDLTFDTSSLLPDQITQIVRMMKKLVLQMCLCLPTANTYKGYSFDVFTGLYYLQSRYYDPEVGRFINADDVDYLGVGNRPLSYNLFAYCENNPVNNSDESGYISLNSVKKALSKIVNYIKRWSKTIINYITREAKRFLKVIIYKNKKIMIDTTAASLIIDAVLATFFKVGAYTMPVFGKTLNLFKRFAKNKMQNFFKNQMVPVLTRGFVNSFLTKIRKIVWSIVSKTANVTLEYTSEYALNQIYKRFSVLEIVAMFTSWGSFISTALDVMDGENDDYVVMWRC